MVLLAVLLSITLCGASVDFSHSTLYDISDFKGKDEVHLPKCDNGCVIFASTASNGIMDPPGYDNYANNLLIYESRKNLVHYSIADLSLQYDEFTSEKTPLIIMGPVNISVLNHNSPNNVVRPIVLYVVEQPKAAKSHHEVYDAINMVGINMNRASITTVMSTHPFMVVANATDTRNGVTARLAGFDNALDSDIDECPVAFNIPAQDLFGGFDFFINGPIITLVFDERYTVPVDGYKSTTSDTLPNWFDGDGFVTSPGYNGCRKPQSGGVQSFPSPFADKSDNIYFLNSIYENQVVTIDVEPNLDEDHNITVTDVLNFKQETVAGTKHVSITFKTNSVWVEFGILSGDQGFLLRYTWLDAINSTSTVSTTTQITTTNSHGIDRLYCNCAMDKFGMPLDWQSTEIWLDVVIILDSSEALTSKSLQESASFIESLLGDGDYDVLTTDHTAPFYTRVGVIAMGDVPEVLYNLNMTKKDTVRDKVSIKQGLSQIDLTEAFYTAQEMLAKGLISEPNRAYTRQVVHFITNSQSNSDTTVFEDLKASGGVIIVNNVLNTGEQPKESLKFLASAGYFFSDIEDYMDNVQALCKANCYCGVGQTAYNGDSNDPAMQAADGCYVASAAGVSFNKAKQTCAGSRGGIIATVHDSNKGPFVNKLISDSAPRQFFFWIGYSKGDDGNWRWEDESSDSFTNWAVDEPSSAPVAKCAYVDQSSLSFQWGAGNCNTGFPYACEYAPCAVGNKNCIFT